ncbi:Ger(x)C family spore germination protein [Paenibacillus lupini]|uniref:Ger(x)C family spore germination protein n=1 Tax=Paenibacillus lupini TaxID=1450204 RepID=UPI001FB9FEF5|nr:Ger(x)C family spore germination protein [Paenibacillus lupini]NIK21719.1 Ger(x)C family germination protein [Paenibacillus lupini]
MTNTAMKIKNLSRAISISIIWVILLMLTGCWDRREINDVAFVLAGGADKEGDNIRISVLIPLTGNMGDSGGGGGSGGQKPYSIKTETGKTVSEAVSKLQSRLSRHLFFGHRRVIIVGEELARTGGIETVIDAITRTPEKRLSTFIAVSEGSALDMLNADTRLERFSAESMREELQSETSAGINLKEILYKLISIGDDAYFPYVQKVKTKIEGQESEDIRSDGFVLFHNGRMTGELTGNSALGFRLLNQSIRNYDETINIDGSYLTVSINQAKISIKPIVKNEELSYRIHSRVKVSIREDKNLERNYSYSEQRYQIEQSIAQHVVDNINLAINKMQQNNSDAIGFGLQAYRAYPKIWTTKYRKDWDELFPKIKFEVTGEANVFRLGMSSENLGKKDN